MAYLTRLMRATRRAAAALALLVAACGAAESKYRGRTASEWAKYLWSPTPTDAGAALDALVEFAGRRPEPVLAALEEAIQTPPTPPGDAPFSFTVDRDAAKALGLVAVADGEAANAALPILHVRIQTLGAGRASLKANPDGTIDVVLPGGRSRADVERIQAALAIRGALDLRVVAGDPAERPASAATRVVYDDPMPYATRLETEAKRERDAHAAGEPYAPESRRWRAVRRADGSGHVLVEEPLASAEALDDRMVAGARAATRADGRVVVVLSIRDDALATWRAFASKNAGLPMAVVLDGALLGTTPVPARADATIDLALWPVATPEAERAASDLAIVLSGGRLPWPIASYPLPASFGRDPAPDNAVARTLLAIGEKSIPVLDRVAKNGRHAWSRESAKWALARLTAPR